MKLRSEKISYQSANSNSFFFPTILPEEGLERYYSYDVSIQPFIKKAVFFSGGKNVGHVNVACNFGHVWPCLVILGMIMINVAYLSVMFPLSRLKYCF